MDGHQVTLPCICTEFFIYRFPLSHLGFYDAISFFPHCWLRVFYFCNCFYCKCKYISLSSYPTTLRLVYLERRFPVTIKTISPIPLTHPPLALSSSVLLQTSLSKLLLYIMKKIEQSNCFLIWYCSARSSANTGTHKAGGERVSVFLTASLGNSRRFF